MTGDIIGGHAFISYVHEDGDHVDRLQKSLEAAGVRVWRDSDKLWPGDDWKIKIRQAITDDSLVFLACFSDTSVTKAKSYQNEEILLAVEQFRLRQPDQPWLIPVRFSDCKVPPHDLGAGRTLDSIHRIDLFGDQWEAGSVRLAVTVIRTMAGLDHIAGRAPEPLPKTTSDPTGFVKGALLDPTRQIELDDFVMDQANTAATALADRDAFPLSTPELVNGPDGIRYLVARATKYWDTLEPFLNTLIPGCAWGKADHLEIWTRAVERVVNSSNERPGQSALINLQQYPVSPIVYAAGLVALHRKNWSALRSVAIDARYRDFERGPIPLIGAAHIWRPFQNIDLVATVLALESDGIDVDDAMLEGLTNRTIGRRRTPVSDHLHSKLRPLVDRLIPDDQDYTATFDRLEVLLGALAVDAKAEAHKSGMYLDGAWWGSFTWRDRFGEPMLERRILNEAEAEGGAWGPLAGGLFGGESARATAALETFIIEAAHGRRTR